MENNKVFKFIWRANAVFLFIAGVSLIGLLLMSAFFLASELGGSDAPPPTVSETPENRQSNEIFVLRDPSSYGQKILDEFTYFELRTGTDSHGKFSSGSSSQLRNIGVYNLREDTVYWVFPDAQQEIERCKSVGKTVVTDTGDKNLTRTGFLLTIARTLPDGSIARDLWSMSPDGTELTKILSDIPSAPTIESYGENYKKLIIETKTHIDVYPFDVDMLTVGKPTRVSIP